VTRSVTPVGLTRAEEASEQGQPKVRIVVKAPPGAVKCRVIVPPNGDDCPAAAVCRIVWSDGDETPSCADCARRLNQQAETQHHMTLRIDPLR
jgi:hypothetical protein